MPARTGSCCGCSVFSRLAVGLGPLGSEFPGFFLTHEMCKDCTHLLSSYFHVFYKTKDKKTVK